MDEMMSAQQRVEREVTGRYDLAWYTAKDLYLEIVQPREALFSGLAEQDLRAWVQAWLNHHTESAFASTES